MRSGTLNVPAIVGLGKACEIAGQEMAAEAERLGRLRDKLKDKLLSSLDYVQVNGSMAVSYTHLDVYKRQPQSG